MPPLPSCALAGLAPVPPCAQRLALSTHCVQAGTAYAPEATGLVYKPADPTQRAFTAFTRRRVRTPVACSRAGLGEGDSACCSPALAYSPPSQWQPPAALAVHRREHFVGRCAMLGVVAMWTGEVGVPRLLRLLCVMQNSCCAPSATGICCGTEAANKTLNSPSLAQIWSGLGPMGQLSHELHVPLA